MIKEQGSGLVEDIGALQSYKIDIEQKTIDQWAAEEGHAKHIQEKRVPYEAWRSCFRHFDGTIYLADRNKSIDGGKSIVKHDIAGLDKISIHQFIGTPAPSTVDGHAKHGAGGGSVFSRPGLFLALDGRMYIKSPGVYHVKSWRSTDNLKSITVEKAVVNVPGGPIRDRKPSEWYGLYFGGDIILLPMEGIGTDVIIYISMISNEKENIADNRV